MADLSGKRVCVGLALDRPGIDAVGMARILGVPGERVEKAPDVGAALRRGLGGGGPYRIDVTTDPAFT